MQNESNNAQKYGVYSVLIVICISFLILPKQKKRKLKNSILKNLKTFSALDMENPKSKRILTQLF